MHSTEETEHFCEVHSHRGHRRDRVLEGKGQSKIIFRENRASVFVEHSLEDSDENKQWCVKGDLGQNPEIPEQSHVSGIQPQDTV